MTNALAGSGTRCGIDFAADALRRGFWGFTVSESGVFSFDAFLVAIVMSRSGVVSTMSQTGASTLQQATSDSLRHYIYPANHGL
jgi:hypothetical protein